MMTAQNDLSTVWGRLDEHRHEIRMLERDHSETKGKISLLDNRLNNFSDALSDHRNESREALKQINASMIVITTEIRSLALEAAANSGAGVSRREALGWAVSLVTIIGGIVAAFKYVS